MEALDGGNNRQSDLLSLINRDVKPRIVHDRAYSTASTNMAASMISPTSTTYSNAPPPPYTIGWHNTPPNPSSGFLSPPESRRTSDNKAEPPPPIQTQHPRQSLPSIHEALSSGPSGVKPGGPYVSPVSASLSHSQHQLPYASQGSSIPRTYPPETHSYPSHLGPAQPRHPSPLQPTHPQSIPFGRSEPAPASYTDGVRHGPSSLLQTAPGPPPNPYAPRTPYEFSRYESESRPMGSGYTHHPPSTSQATYQYAPSPSMPPHVQQNPVDPRYSQPSKDVNGSEVTHFRHNLKRHLDVWGVGHDLEIIENSCTSVQEWARHYNQIAREQQGPIPDRMPSVKSCQQQIDDARKTLDSLERMKEILQNQEATERQRESGHKQPPSDYDDEYGMDEKYPSGEFKKRRGRAAPPGRCHSCNRDETPEWRRGPDGARTLCNACGLHYAKLTRKNALMQSQGKGSALRPKSMDSNTPRPL